MSQRIPTKSANGFVFVLAMWLLSRLVIVATMELIAPMFPASIMYGHSAAPSLSPKIGWEVFSNWDANYYRDIATSGYEYVNDTNKHSVAFFPVFPLVIHAVMSLGLPSKVAGTLVNNIAFLGAINLIYRWVKEHYGVNTARWTTVVLAWCPFSLFGTVIYTEGLFLLLTTAALRAFDNHQHAWAAFWGVIATATRVNSAALIPTFLIVAWREGRPPTAYMASFATGGGLLLFSMYCAIRFGDPLAFVHAQRGWQSQTGFDWRVWWNLFAQDLALGKGWSTAFIALIKIVMIFGGGYLLWSLRAKLSRVVVIYGFCAITLVIISGAITSVGRFAYGIVSLSIALGVLLACHPRWGYATTGLFAILLIYFSLRFSWAIWVA